MHNTYRTSNKKKIKIKKRREILIKTIKETIKCPERFEKEVD